MSSIERKIKKALADIETIHSFVHPLGDPDPRQNLYQARARREDAVRMTVLQMSLSIEDLLGSLFARVFLGHDPASKRKIRVRRGDRFHDFLEFRRSMDFDAKLKLARLLRLVTRKQYGRLDRLRSLRNKCAHAWMLDVVHKRGRKPRPSRRLLEFEGRNLFDLKVLREVMRVYSGIYLKLFDKYLS
jgi:hypothetical protein